MIKQSRKPWKQLVYKLKLNTRPLLLFIIVSCVSTSLLYMYYVKKNDQIIRYTQKIQDLIKQQETLAKTKATKKNLEQSIRALTNQLRSYDTILTSPSPHMAEQPMLTIAKNAHKMGLHITSCTRQKTKKTGWLKKQTATYDLIGTTAQIDRFIKNLSQKSMTLKCKKLAFNRTAQNKTRLCCTLQFLSLQHRQKVT